MSKTANLSAIIIDDHPLARMAIRNLLENEGFNIVAEAGDGGEALMAVAEYQPDVVIVDVDIPVMSGIEVVEKLRKKQFSHIIIVVSAKNDLFYGKRSADAGANAFISKKGDKQYYLCHSCCAKWIQLFSFFAERLCRQLI